MFPLGYRSALDHATSFHRRKHSKSRHTSKWTDMLTDTLLEDDGRWHPRRHKQRYFAKMNQKRFVKPHNAGPSSHHGAAQPGWWPSVYTVKTVSFSAAWHPILKISISATRWSAEKLNLMRYQVPVLPRSRSLCSSTIKKCFRCMIDLLNKRKRREVTIHHPIRASTKRRSNASNDTDRYCVSVHCLLVDRFFFQQPK